jgi:farnesyl-diphosphate farnesyltransferase
MVNILRDLPRDLRQGRCYIPREKLTAVGLKPEDLLDKASEAKFRPVYEDQLKRAQDYLKAGWEYTNALPRNQWRLRLACAWPVLIGVKTISQLRQSPILSGKGPVKIDRAEVRKIMFRSVLGLFSPPAWQKQFQQAANP